jgi:hypothetical protein
VHAQTLCAQVARRLGEPERLVARHGFQPLMPTKRSAGAALSAVTCPFCGGQVLVAPGGAQIEAECRRCDTAFLADDADAYAVALDDAERPAARRFLHEIW